MLLICYVSCSKVYHCHETSAVLLDISAVNLNMYMAKYCEPKYKETSILGSHHEETREFPGERDTARNNARCMQMSKTTHSLDGQHQDVDRTPRGRVNQNDRDEWRKYVHGVARGRLKNACFYAV